MKLSKEDYFTDDCIVEDDLYYSDSETEKTE